MSNRNTLNNCQQEWLDKLNQEIDKQIADANFKAEDLAKLMYKSRTQLYETVKALTGLSPIKYIQRVRITKAHQLILSNTYDYFKDIVTAVGFKSSDSLQQVYHTIYEESPIVFFERLWGERLKAMILRKIDDSQYTVEDLIFDMNLDRRTLYKRTKSVTGLSPGRYIRLLKLERAKNLLENDKANSIKEVAQSVGFQRTDYFSKLYNEHYKN